MSAPDLRVLSYGGGTQSAALALMSAAGELPKLDAVVFADTHGELPETGVLHMIVTHAYGPHRDDDAPTSVTIRTRTGEQTVPYPAALLAQRRAINSIAHQHSQPIREDNRA